MTSRLPQLAAWALLAVVPAVLLVALFTVDSLQGDHASPAGHFYIVSAVALISLGLAVAASVAALRLHSARTLLLSLAFLSMAGVFAVHGLATPGFLVDRPVAASAPAHHTPFEASYGASGGAYAVEGGYGPVEAGGGAVTGGGSPYGAVVGLSARLSVLLAALFLAASAVDWPRRVAGAIERHALAILVGWSVVLLAYAVVALRLPGAVPPFIARGEVFLDTTLVAVIALSVFAAWRYAQGYRHSGLPMYSAVAIGALLIGEAQIAMHFGATWDRAWWLYHVQLLAGFATLLWGLISEYSRGRSTTETFQRLALRDALEQVEAGYSDVTRALATSLEARDPYTHGHGHRVAALAFLIGREMGLSPERLRGLAQGALLHDVGKLSVPDRILRKPGPLTLEEYAQIKDHPEAGERVLAATLAGGIERAVVRHHHERFDGTGYPDGLAGDAIPLEARITTVADVYDAVRSTRAYRHAWGRDRAMDLIERGSGSHFDPRCVAAFHQVVERWEREFAPEAAEIDADAAMLDPAALLAS